jgi:hypothetical protein
VLGFLAAAAIAVAGVVTSSDFGGEPGEPQAPAQVPEATTPPVPGPELTFVLVATAEEASYLMALRAEADALLDPRFAGDRVVIFVADTPEAESSAMESIRTVTEAGPNEPLISYRVVDVRETGLVSGKP